MRRLRLALALCAVALAYSPSAASANAGCPSIIHGPEPYHACGLRSGGSCESCTYLCSDGEEYTWNMCGVIQ